MSLNVVWSWYTAPGNIYNLLVHHFIIVWFLCVSPKGIRIHLFNPLKHDWRWLHKKRAHRSKAAWSWQRRAKLEARAIPNDFVALHYAHPPCVYVCVSLFSISHSPITQIVLHPPTHASALFTLRLNQLSSFVTEQNRRGCLCEACTHPLNGCSR